MEHTPTIPLSDAKLRNLEPIEKSFRLSDFDSLYVFVRPSGTWSWRFKYWIDSVEKITKEGRASATLVKYDRILKMASADKPMSEITAPIELDCLRKVEARGNFQTGPFAGFTPETQKWPGNPNHSGCPPATFRPGQAYSFKMTLEFFAP